MNRKREELQQLYCNRSRKKSSLSRSYSINFLRLDRFFSFYMIFLSLQARHEPFLIVPLDTETIEKKKVKIKSRNEFSFSSSFLRRFKWKYFAFSAWTNGVRRKLSFSAFLGFTSWPSLSFPIDTFEKRRMREIESL